MPASPLSARHEPLMAAVGATVLVVGGRTTPACPPGAGCAAPQKPALTDGAIFDPEAGTWTPVPDAPVPITGTGPAVETGSAVWSVQAVDNQPVLVGFSPSEGWRRVEIPQPAGWRIAASGDRVVVYPGSHESGGLVPDRLFDPDTGAWSQLPKDPIGSAYDRSIVGVDDGVVLLAIPLVDVPPPDRPRVFHAARYTTSTDAWTPLPPSTIPGYTDAWYRHGSRIVNPTLGSVDGGAVNSFDRAYELGGVLEGERGWNPLPKFRDVATGAGSTTLAAGDRWVVASTGSAGSELALLDLAELTWRAIPGSELFSRTAPGRVVAGNRLLVWGGADFDPPAPLGRLHNDGAQLVLG